MADPATAMDPQNNSASSDTSLDRLIALHLQVRDQVSSKTREYDLFKSQAQVVLDEIEAKIRATLNSTGAEGARTAAGSVHLRTTKQFAVTDWDKVYQHMRETGRMDLLQRRLATTRVEELAEEDGKLIDGITFGQKVTVSVTRPTAKS